MPVSVNSSTSSSSVILDDVDDYLAPSQACVNPLFQDAKKITPKEQNGTVIVPRKRRVVRRPVKMDSSPKPPPVKDPVKASIADCLACSGCVTTAETVLLEQRHSLTSLRQRLEKDRRRVVTISPNVWADLRRHWKWTNGMYSQVTTLLQQVLQADVVVDANLPLLWTWQEEAQEFVELYRQNAPTTPPTPLPSVAIDANRTMVYHPDGSTTVDQSLPPPSLPLISGSCPALVCLVEKSMHSLVPHLSQTVSAMSRMGLVLQATTGTWDHWAIMPCHDKKLEASRKDFAIQEEAAVDLVISTMELVELVDEWIQQQNTTLLSCLQSLTPAQTVNFPVDSSEKQVQDWLATHNEPALLQLQPDTSDSQQLVGDVAEQMAMASGGHADFIFRYAAQELFDCHVPFVEWESASLASNSVKSARLAKQQKQHSYMACLYRHADGTIRQTKHSKLERPPELLLKFAIAHGMQTMQRALKNVNDKRDDFHYLEAMACPYGCINGGGAAVSVRETPTETRSRVTQTRQQLTLPTYATHPDDPSRRTRYHVVPPMQHTMGAAAGVNVQDIQW